MNKVIGPLVVASIFSHASAFSIVQWPVSSGGNGHYYELFENATTWDLAYLGALASVHDGQPGTLATITSLLENDFVAANLLTSVTFYEAWIGGFQPGASPEPDGNWQWVTGELWAFQNWDAFEPSNVGGNENALWMFSDFNPPSAFGKWNDAPSSFERPYIVEYLPEPGSALLCMIGIVMVASRRNRLTCRPSSTPPSSTPTASSATAIS